MSNNGNKRRNRADRDESKNERLFIAYELPDEIKEEMISALKVVRKNAPEGRAVKEDNLHITARFLGDTDKDLKDKLMEVIKDIGNDKGKDLKAAFSGYTFFRGVREATLIATFNASDDLKGLTDSLNRKIDELGFTIERRSWKPHITLSRAVDSDKFDIKCLPEIPQGPYRIKTLTLFRSEFTRSGMKYTKLLTIDL